MSIILDKVNKINEVLDIIPCSSARNLCKSIERRELDSRFYLGIIGEFKRGKSTMINSLIGRDILPSDILPTTVMLNILEYSEKEYIEIVYNDGSISERKNLSKENLEVFTAQSEEDIDCIDHIKIGLNCELLKLGMVIIDTPGVNDVSQSRIEITKNILPNCDAAVFLLDAASPLTKSEAEFLETKILTYKLNSLMFIISKCDRLYEDELEEALEGAEDRIQRILNFNAPLMEYSSKKVIDYENKNDGVQHQYKEKLLRYIEELRNKSIDMKNEAQINNLKLAASLTLKEVEKQIKLNSLDKSKLQEAKTKAVALCKQSDVKFKQFILSGEYVGRSTLHDMFNKSFDIFINKLINECIDSIRVENNVRNYYIKVMPVVLERNIRKFGEEKGSEIHIYLSKVTEHMCREYSINFQKPIVEELKNIGIEMPVWQMESGETEEKNTYVKSLLPITVGALIGMIFMPGIGNIIGGACGQIISVNHREKENEELRRKLITEIPVHIKNSLEDYRTLVNESIDKCFDKLFNNFEVMNIENQNDLKAKFKISEVNMNKNELDNNTKTLENIELRLNEIIMEL